MRARWPCRGDQATWRPWLFVIRSTALVRDVCGAPLNCKAPRVQAPLVSAAATLQGLAEWARALLDTGDGWEWLQLEPVWVGLGDLGLDVRGCTRARGDEGTLRQLAPSAV